MGAFIGNLCFHDNIKSILKQVLDDMFKFVHSRFEVALIQAPPSPAASALRAKSQDLRVLVPG